MYRKIIALFAAIATTLSVLAAPTASKLLDEMRAKMVEKPALEAMFTVKGAQAFQGSIRMSGASFVLTSPEMTVWFDGKTQWTYLKSSNEVSISEPDGEELATTNPFTVLRDYAKYYNARVKSNKANTAVVILSPKTKKSAIKSISININTTSKWPTGISVELSDKKQIALSVDRIAHTAPIAASAFRFDKKKFPKAEIIDLR